MLWNQQARVSSIPFLGKWKTKWNKRLLTFVQRTTLSSTFISPEEGESLISKYSTVFFGIKTKFHEMKFDIQMKFKFPFLLFATDWSYKDIRISNGKVSKKKFIR